MIAGVNPVLVHNVGCGTTIYRGVPENDSNGIAHPGFDAATEGIAAPQGGNASAADHQAGNTDSPYVSWSTSYRVAERRAKAGESGYGVVIESEIPADVPYIYVNDEPWADRDYQSEYEVLMQGEVQGTSTLVGPGLAEFKP